MEEALMTAAHTDVVNESGLTELLNNYNSNSRVEGHPAWLLVALQRNNIQFLKVASRVVRDIGWIRDENGYTAMHYTCSRGLVESTEVLARFDRTLCLLRGNDGRIPLHVAAADDHGQVELLKVLLAACPESIEWGTYQEETALHLAATSSNFYCFTFLFQEALKRKQRRKLLNWPNHQGDTVLHIATTLKRIQILKLMLSGTHKRWVEVNAKNGSELTALDLLYRNRTSGRHDKDISELLHGAGAKEGCQILSHETQQPESARPHLSVSVFILFAGGVLACLSNFPTTFEIDHNRAPVNSTGPVVPLRVEDMISQPHLLPPAFYFLVMINAVFTVSMVEILRATNFSGVMIFLTAAISFAYVLMVQKFVPRFLVTTIGSRNISSFLVVWLYDLALILLYFLPRFIIKLIRGIIFSILRRTQVEYIEIREENVDEEAVRIDIRDSSVV